MAVTTVSARIDGDLKNKAEEVFSALGLTHTVAINALYAQVVLQGGLPFDLRLPLEHGVLSFQTIRSKVRSLAKTYGLKRVYLFGSYARGEAKGSSDVDVRIDKGDARGFALGGFQYDLEKALGKKVDVVSTAGASEAFLNRIAEDEVLLYER